MFYTNYSYTLLEIIIYFLTKIILSLDEGELEESRTCKLDLQVQSEGFKAVKILQ